MPRKIIFLDRDGVINKEIGYLHKVEDFEFIYGVFSSLRKLQAIGYEFVIVTNQSGIGRKMYSLEQFQNLDIWMKEQFLRNRIKILDSFYCPHLPSDNCSCRKPKTGMFDRCFSKYEVDKCYSWMIGDSEKDITAANNAGIENTIIVKSGHEINEKKTNALFVLNSIKNAPDVILS